MARREKTLHAQHERYIKKQCLEGNNPYILGVFVICHQTGSAAANTVIQSAGFCPQIMS
jgi:hypothetical protein